jgi:Mor family transcriptional regulator
MNAQTEFALPPDDMGDLLAHAAGNAPDDKWPVTLAEMVDVLVATYVKRGREHDAAIAEARWIVITIANYQGGRPVYLPRGDRLLTALRNREIYLKHRGNNTDGLAQEYGLTTRQIQSIIAEQYALQVRKRQGKLFPTEGEEK